MKAVEAYLSKKGKIINSELDRCLREHASAPLSVNEAMKYAVFAGGKRIRPILAIASCEALGGNQREFLPTACAIELIHTYSLIHDDLPSMDNDDYRRGKPSTHKAFGEAIAILAGDALLTLAFELMSELPVEDKAGSKASTEAEIRSRKNELIRKKLEIIRTVSSACGSEGLIGGQVKDLESEGKEIGLSEFETLHLMKTSALIEASLMAGAIMADVSIENKRIIADFGRKIGFAYQIIDDLLDAEGTIEVVGKRTKKDHKKKKATFPLLYGIEGSRRLAHKLTEEAKNRIRPLGDGGKILSLLAEFIVSRTR